MRVVEIVETAAHVCVLLAMAPAGKGIPAAKLAEFHELSATSVAKQLQQLRAAGIVTGTAGRSGGYQLARPAGEISLLQIVQSVEGDIEGFKCQEIRRNGPCAGKASDYRAPCAIAAAMRQAERAWRDSLASVTLQDVCRSVGRQLPNRLLKTGQVWMERVIR